LGPLSFSPLEYDTSIGHLYQAICLNSIYNQLHLEDLGECWFIETYLKNKMYVFEINQ